MTICLGQKPYTFNTILVIATSEIDSSVGLATALGMRVAPLTLKALAFPPSSNVPVKGTRKEAQQKN